nr:2-C-methyl-D-erythritol 4-phosphate cytidylyltransferase [Phytoactinopolyspora halophila]
MAEVGLIIPAAGMGTRLGSELPKALHAIGGTTVLAHALRAGVGSGTVSSIVIAAPSRWETRIHEQLEYELPDTVEARVVEGGERRQDSVRRAMDALPGNIDIVLVHDAARCLTPPALFGDVVSAVAGGHDAVVPGLPVVDTLREVDDRGVVVRTPDRTVLRAVQTPQGFRREVLEDAYRAAAPDEPATDDASLVERTGHQVHIVPGHSEAFKVTHPLDVLLAEALLARRASS